MNNELHLVTENRLEEWKGKGIDVSQLVDNELAIAKFNEICSNSVGVEDYTEAYEWKCKIEAVRRGLKVNIDIYELLNKDYSSEEMDKICDKLLHKEPVEFSDNDSSENNSSFNHKEPCNQMNLFGSPTKLFSIYKR